MAPVCWHRMGLSREEKGEKSEKIFVGRSLYRIVMQYLVDVLVVA
jgi:hypothetical protein